jgi:hypothetical protein
MVHASREVAKCNADSKIRCRSISVAAWSRRRRGYRLPCERARFRCRHCLKLVPMRRPCSRPCTRWRLPSRCEKRDLRGNRGADDLNDAINHLHGASVSGLPRSRFCPNTALHIPSNLLAAFALGIVAITVATHRIAISRLGWLCM